MGFDPTTLLDLVGCSNHWATGDSMVSKGQFMVLDWNHITQLHSQVMTGTHKLTNSITLSFRFGFPPFPSRSGSKITLKSPPIIMLQSSARLKLSNSSLISSKNIDCSFVLFGAYKLTKRKGWSWTFASRMMKRPFWSTLEVLSSNSKEFLIRMRTPLLCSVSCEKNICPFHWDFQILSTSGVLYDSCKKQISDLSFINHPNNAFRFSKDRIPRAFSDNNLKLMLLGAIFA